MKKTFRILGLALVVTGLLFSGCKKTEDEEEEEDATANIDVSAPETQMNKNVLLEEFSGNNCPYCPDGHKRANELVAANPGRVFPIIVHSGYLASRYTTSFSGALDTNAGAYKEGYPAGSLNRHIFDGDRTAMNRGYWSYYLNQELSQQAVANIAAKATINQSTREVTVGVAVYYTGTPTGSTNYINVAITEDSIWGQQRENSESTNPAQWNSDHTQYCHLHMLRHLMTGTWGSAITPATGKQIKKEFKYTLPDQIANETVVPAHLHIIVFLCQDRNEVINVCEAPVTLK